MKIRLALATFCLSLLSIQMMGQKLEPPKIEPQGFAWKKVHTANKLPIALTPVREADVMYSKRVWRKIDLREKSNMPLFYPIKATRDRKSFAALIFDAVSKPSAETPYSANYLTAYDDEDFTMRINSLEELRKRMVVTVTEDSITEANPDGEKVTKKYPLRSDHVVQIDLIGDWFFDEKRSQLDFRIQAIGITYDRSLVSPSAVNEGQSNLSTVFWIYYPESRFYLANNEAFNPRNDAARMSYDEFFLRRKFSSYIYKVANVYDRRISEYTSGLDALYESERIKNEILTYENDLWEY